MKVAVTGASGFVGRAVMSALGDDNGVTPVAILRREPGEELPYQYRIVGDMDGQTDWRDALEGVDVLIHCAARVHVMQDDALDPLDEYRRVNVDGTRSLARQAADEGIKRFIFVSSIKVNGEETRPGQPYRPEDAPSPLDPYGASKYEAEQELQKIACQNGMEWVIVRPPLVYGPGVGANFLSMMRWLGKGVPLPLGGLRNKRSMIARANLSDFIRVCVRHPAAADQVFLVSDAEDLSTTELLILLGEALGRPARLIPFPAGLLNFIATVMGKSHISRRLCGNLQVDSSKVAARLGWHPPLSVSEGLRQTAEYFIGKK